MDQPHFYNPRHLVKQAISLDKQFKLENWKEDLRESYAMA